MSTFQEYENLVREGFNRDSQATNPYLRTSRAWEAFEIGRWLHGTGRMIDSIRPSRGDTWKTGRGMLLRLAYGRKGQFSITRES